MTTITLSEEKTQVLREILEAQHRLAFKETERARTLGNEQAADEWLTHATAVMVLLDHVK